MVELPDLAVREYLAATGMAAVYVAEGAGAILRIGPTPDVNATDEWLRAHAFELRWLLWCTALRAARRLCQAPAQLFVRPNDGLIVSAKLPDVIQIVLTAAEKNGDRVAQHDYILARSRALAERVDELLDVMQRSGRLKAFNESYRTYRLAEEALGRRVDDYRVLLARLRVNVIRALVQGEDALATVRRDFPWLSNERVNATRG